MAKPGKQGRRQRRPLVELEGVIVQLGDHPQLCGIDWVLAEGEHWIVSGPTGSGKSMLGQALCRQVPIHGGLRYHFDGTRTQGRSYLNRGEAKSMLSFSSWYS